MASYRYTAVEVSSGLKLADFPLVNGSFTRLINAPGTWSADLPLGDARVKRMDPITNTEKNSVEIVVERRRALGQPWVVVYDGLITDRSYDSRTQVLTISGKEAWCYFDRRLIEWDLTYSQVDEGLIVQDILTRAAGSPAGDFRVDLPTTAQLTTGKLRDRTYLALDAKPISAAIEELAAVINGFEFTVDGYWQQTAGASPVLRHRLNFGYPQLGVQVAGYLKWELPGAVSWYTWRESGSAQVNEIFGIGDNGSGGVTIQRAKLLSGRQLLLQAAKSFRDIKQLPTLTAEAQAAVAAAQLGQVAAQVEVVGDRAPEVASYGLGDAATFDFNDPRFGGTASTARIIGWTLMPPTPGRRELVDLMLTSPVEMQQQLDDLAKRLRVLETHSLGTPAIATFAAATGPNPPPVVPVTTVVADISVAAGVYTAGLNQELAGVNFNLAKAGTIVIQGQLDCRMDAWDNYVAAPRREVFAGINTIYAFPPQELPFGITEVTITDDNGPATAIGIGTWRVQWIGQVAGGNVLRVYGGWLRATWTG